METSNLLNIDFKTVVIRMFNDLSGTIGELWEDFNKEIGNIYMEIENIKNRNEYNRNEEYIRGNQQQIR